MSWVLQTTRAKAGPGMKHMTNEEAFLKDTYRGEIRQLTGY